MLNLKFFIMKSKLVFIVVLLAVIVSCSNNKSQTLKTVEYADSLRDAIEDFETKRKEFSEQITDIVENTDDKLSEDAPNLQEVAIDWEKKWEELITDFNTIEDNFTTVGNSSAIYFQKLEELAYSIKDDDIKQSELTKNAELKTRWTETYIEAAESINKIRSMLIDGSDYQKVLIASSVRQKIEENIVELKSISEKAILLLKELETFSLEGKKLVETTSK